MNISPQTVNCTVGMSNAPAPIQNYGVKRPPGSNQSRLYVEPCWGDLSPKISWDAWFKGSRTEICRKHNHLGRRSSGAFSTHFCVITHPVWSYRRPVLKHLRFDNVKGSKLFTLLDLNLCQHQLNEVFNVFHPWLWRRTGVTQPQLTHVRWLCFSTDPGPPQMACGHTSLPRASVPEDVML